MVNVTKSSNIFLRAIAGLLAPLYVLGTSINSYAEQPSAAFIANFKGSELRVRRGTNRNTEQVTRRLRLEQYNDILYVPGNNLSWAGLGFLSADGLEYAGLIVKAGPDPTLAQYSFPCTARGSFTIGWRRGSSRGCDEGLRIGRIRRQNAEIPAIRNSIITQATKNSLKVQTNDEVTDEFTVVPGAGQTLIQTRNSDSGIAVDVLIGNVNIKSAKKPQGVNVKAGERYSYPSDQITPIDHKSILNSPSIREFLNPDNWLLPDIPQRIAKGIIAQLTEHQTGLGSIASNPGTTPDRQVINPESNSSQGTIFTSSITEFPIYETVGISTTPNVQPLTFSPNGSLTLSSSKFSPFQPLKRTISVFSLPRLSLTQFTQLKTFKFATATGTQLQPNEQISQIPGINLPIPGGGIIQDAVMSQVAKELAKVLGNESPITASLKDIYPTVSEPPGGPFAPSNNSLQQFYQALKKGGMTISLPPGDYSVPVHVFCMQSSAHAPTSSETFLLAPLKGKLAKAIAALNSRFVTTGISRDTIQHISWAIQAGTKYEELSPEQRQIIDRLIPEYKQQLSQSFWEKLESTLAAIPGAPSLDSVVGRLGPTGQILGTYRQARAAIQQHGNNYSALERALLLPGRAPSGSDSRYPRGTWSKISDRIYARLLPTGLGTPGSLDIRVLPTR